MRATDSIAQSAEPFGAVEPSPMPQCAAICRCLPRRQRNYVSRLRLRPTCMIGDLGLLAR
jgi:hypothetical protein